MPKHLTSREVERRCAYCEHLVAADNGRDTGICEKRGPVNLGSSCMKYVYDPLKRVPPKQVKLEAYEE